MNMDKIMGLTADEVIAVVDLCNLAKEAKEISKLIHDNHKSFGIGEKRICVRSEGPNTEFITYTGHWVANYVHQSYDIHCSPDGIFNAMKAHYFKEKGADMDDHMFNLAEGYEYFSSFVYRLRKEVEAKQAGAKENPIGFRDPWETEPYEDANLRRSVF